MNPGREALTRAVNRAIAEGAPVYINQPADIDDVDDDPGPFSFDQLSARAKERARDNHRYDDVDNGFDWWDHTYEDFVRIAQILNLDIGTFERQTTRGETITCLRVWFSGFGSQGDGACFEGYWEPMRDPLAALNVIIEYTSDEKLHETAFALAHLSERLNNLMPDATVRMTHSGRYYHSGCVSFNVDMPTPGWVEDDHELQVMVFNALLRKHRLEYVDVETEVKEIFRSLMNWLYRQLYDEHDYLTSDEHVDERLADLQFDEDGNDFE